MDLQGTSALVAGGASGLGEDTVRALAGRRARVAVQDERGEDLGVYRKIIEVDLVGTFSGGASLQPK